MIAGRSRPGGNSIVEFSLMAPWILFLFAGAFDWGFYSYALILVQNGARVAAQYNLDKFHYGDGFGNCMVPMYFPNLARRAEH